MSAAFDALGNEVRREILQRLVNGPLSVGEIAADLPVSRPAVSRHLRLLEEAELVETQKDGRRSVVALKREGFDVAREWLDAFWDDALRRFKMVAENTEEDRDR